MSVPVRPTRPYRPSNGTEGEGFIGHWCERCMLDRAARVHQDYTNGCDILARSLMFNLGDPGYPVEWQQYTDKPWEAFCTAFVEDDHDDDWEPPPPPDPDQLVLLADPTEDAATIQNAPTIGAHGTYASRIPTQAVLRSQLSVLPHDSPPCPKCGGHPLHLRNGAQGPCLGRCGHVQPLARLSCELPSGHDGLHSAKNGAVEWSTNWPEAPASPPSRGHE